jgi:hypothetical protein
MLPRGLRAGIERSKPHDGVKMTHKKVRILIGAIALFVVVLVIAGRIASGRLEPYVKEKSSEYLRKRFASELSWEQFNVAVSFGHLGDLLLLRGSGAVVTAEVDGIVMRHKSRKDIPPLIEMKKLRFDVDLLKVLNDPPHVHLVTIEGLELNIPPKGSRLDLTVKEEHKEAPQQHEEEDNEPSVIIDRIVADGTRLRIFPREPHKDPLNWEMRSLRLERAGDHVAMDYDAILTNAKPPGLIDSAGMFGPWNADEPGETPLGGDYTFSDADLGVFKGIAGILSSTGKFKGRLNEIVVDGETQTPDFRLETSGNPVPLHTKFHAIVDGTNGNTLLQPVEATLNGKTRFIAKGGVVKEPRDVARAISLDVTMEDGSLEDVLLLAMRGKEAMLEGVVNLDMKFDLLPEKGELADRLRLDGTFELLSARFNSAETQEKIDSFSRRGQGRPEDKGIENVKSNFAGTFFMENGVFTLRELQFEIPGALVDLAGDYTFADESIDLKGKLYLQARLSKTMTGWKRILLTPIDPFFAKDGAGTVLGVAVTGSRKNPEFGLD